jgi:putative flavoprotein involved in K+ transport
MYTATIRAWTDGSSAPRLSRSLAGFIKRSACAVTALAQVVVATGPYHEPRVPDFARELNPEIRQLHSSQYRNRAQLRAGGVLVVGAGNSGAEIAFDVAREHRTWLSG